MTTARAAGRAAWAAAALAWLLSLCPAIASATVVEPTSAQLLAAPDARPPPSNRPWQSVSLPDNWNLSRPHVPPAPSWYRIPFDLPAGAEGRRAWALYLPYFYGGGQVWLNGEMAWQVPENSPAEHVRWARPHLVPLPASLLRSGPNELMLRAAMPPLGASMYLPRLGIGPQDELLPIFERRFFWVTVTPQITAAVCLLVAAFVLFIWWRRPGEVLYGLFAVAAGLWGIRTLTFVVEVVPTDLWLLWRLTYLGATGGFIVVLTYLALRLAGIHKPWIERGLALYWLAGPAWLIAGGAAAEPSVNRYWIAGFLPIGTAIMLVSLWTVWRKRTLQSAILPAAMVVGVLAGLHDYFVNWSVAGTGEWLGEWAGHRIFLLHHGANLVLVAMGGLLASRFIHALGSLEELNQTLEQRVAERERELAGNYVRMGALQRQHAAVQERQTIMREIHDGLGSQLFVSLSRVERGDMQPPEIADALRGCIADMRIALDTLTPDDHDFRATLGDFLFRWQGQLAAAGIHPAWTIDLPDDAPGISPHATLQLLRIAQEALTNVLKHANASRVHVRFRHHGDALEMEVEDDGKGPGHAQPSTGHGIGNMQARGSQLGGTLEVRDGGPGTCVRLRVPLDTLRA